MKTHIDNTIEERVKKYCYRYDTSVCKSYLDKDRVEELVKLIKSESKRYADERVREFASWCDLDQEVIFNHPHFIQDYAEQFINQNTESEEGVR